MVLYKKHYFLGLRDHFSTYISSFSSFGNDICVDVCIAIYYTDWALSSRIYGMESGIIQYFFSEDKGNNAACDGRWMEGTTNENMKSNEKTQ